jgi:curved DNA-binding protein CbpA
METAQTYYQILGVLPDAEDIVIKAAYRVLAQRYHPDKNAGDSAVASRMAAINEAYATLSDPVKRAAYDEAIKERRNDFDFTMGSDDAGDDFSADVEDDWNYAISYFPEIKKIAAELKTLNKALALAFKLVLLERKNFNQAKDVARALKINFLTRYFGDSELLRNFAETCIMEGKREVALELNKAVRVLGNSLPPRELLRRVEDRFDQNGANGRRFKLIKKLMDLEYQLKSWRELSAAHSAIELLEGKTIVTGMLKKLYQTEVDGEKFSFEDPGQYIDFVLKRIRLRLSDLER